MRNKCAWTRFNHRMRRDFRQWVSKLSAVSPKALQQLVKASKSILAWLHVTSRHTLSRGWPWALTAVVIVGAGLTFFLVPDMQTRSQLGDFLSGVAGTIAFIWLIAAYFQQGQELRLQREELALQRQALTPQHQELQRMSKYTALERASQLLEQFDQRLSKNESGPRSIRGLLTAFYDGMIRDWKIILTLHDPQEIAEIYAKWTVVESACWEFLSSIVSAIELYEEATGTAFLPEDNSAAMRIYLAPNTIMNIPFIRPYIGTAKALAENMILTEPGLNKLQLRGLEAMQTLVPGTINEEALANLRAKVEARETRHSQDES
jgi:hypothetical protein